MLILAYCCHRMSALKAEMKELINKWNNIIIPNFENEASLLELEMKKKHQHDVEHFTQGEQQLVLNQKVHFSSEILEMKKKAETLG